MAGHTPGPWIVLTQGTGVSIAHIEKHPERTGGHRICKMHSGKPNIHADAALIAAAPELLAALVALENAGLLATLLDLDESMADDGEQPIARPLVDAARAAITKATS